MRENEWLIYFTGLYAVLQGVEKLTMQGECMNSQIDVAYLSTLPKTYKLIVLLSSSAKTRKSVYELYRMELTKFAGHHKNRET